MRTKNLCHYVLALMLSTNIYAISVSDLTNRDWLLISLQGKKVATTMYKDEKPNIKFSDDSKFSAWAGCNRLSGAYLITPPNIVQFSPTVISTKMSCPGFYNIEGPFLEMLQAARNLKFDKDKLQFVDKNNAVVAEFVTIPAL